MVFDFVLEFKLFVSILGYAASELTHHLVLQGYGFEVDKLYEVLLEIR